MHETYLALRQAPLHEFDQQETAAFASEVAKWLVDPDVVTRADAAERLATAVLWETLPRGLPSPQIEAHWTERLGWLTSVLDTANAVQPDVIPEFLRELRFRTPRAPQVPVLVAWLDRLEPRPPPGLDVNLILGARIVMGDADWDRAAPRLLAMLDHPSDWVRGCAAYMLGNGCDEDTQPSQADLFRLIGAKEIERPGIAGPFWSPRSHDHFGNRDAAIWMMDLLERRQGPVPSFKEMPANDIDFHLHEVCSLLPDMVDRMMRGGFTALAVMTATEIHGKVEGMEARLHTLARDPDPRIAAGATRHLATYYGLEKSSDQQSD